MPSLKDISGNRFGRLIVISYTGNARWTCRCDCGTEKTVATKHLTTGGSKSCGCLRIETTRARFKTHGLSTSAEHKAWACLKDRCLNAKHRDFHHYGGRGITVCAEWRDSFEAFYRDMGPRPAPHLTIERVDNDCGYSKDNCVWATRTAQARNRRSTVNRKGV